MYKEIPVFFAVDNGYIPFLGVALSSLIENTSKENNKTSTTPKTSDLSNMVMWQVGLAVSGILFVIMLGCKIRSLRKKGRH